MMKFLNYKEFPKEEDEEEGIQYAGLGSTASACACDKKACWEGTSLQHVQQNGQKENQTQPKSE